MLPLRGNDHESTASPASPVLMTDASLMNTKWLILLWYTCSIVGNMTSKMLLMKFNYPSTVMMGPIVFGSLCVPLLSHTLPDRWVGWVLTGHASDAHHRHRWSATSLLRTARDRKLVCAILGCLSLGAGLFHRIALTHVHVSFAHTVKAMQPLYTCIFTYIVFRTVPSGQSALALAIVIAGIMISAFEEVSADTVGVLALQMSMAAASAGSIMQKFIFTGLDRAEVYSLTVGTATFINIWVWLYKDLPVFYDKYSRGQPIHSGDSTFEVLALIALNSLTIAMQHFTSLSALQKLIPTTHATVGCMKRVLVIVAAGIFFGNPITPKNWMGAAMAVAGVTRYEMVKKKKNKVDDDDPAHSPDSAKGFTGGGSHSISLGGARTAGAGRPTAIAAWLDRLSPRHKGVAERDAWV